jgi:hypothetical protein
MSWDENGMFVPDEYRQPLGALGAFTNYMNASKSREIADARQRERLARAAGLEEQNKESARNFELEEQALKAVQALPPGASPDDIVGAVARYRPTTAFPYFRGTRSALGKLDAAEQKAHSEAVRMGVSQGLTYEQALDGADESIRRMRAISGRGVGTAPSPAPTQPNVAAPEVAAAPAAAPAPTPAPIGAAPLPAAKGQALRSGANLSDARVQEILEKTPAWIELTNATAALRRSKAKGGVPGAGLKPMQREKIRKDIETANIAIEKALRAQPPQDPMTGLPLGGDRLTEWKASITRQVEETRSYIKDQQKILGATPEPTGAAGTAVPGPTTTTLSPEAQSLMPK